MKKVISLALAICIALTATSCGSSSEPRNQTVTQTKTVGDILDAAAEDQSQATSAPLGTPASNDAVTGSFDVDLTAMNSTMVYTEVFQMTQSPDSYMGKTVKMAGTLAVYEGDGRNYYACLIADATACCAQGIEFLWKGDHSYPEDYPELGSEITVTGTFDVYYEGDYMYCQLIDAELYTV